MTPATHESFQNKKRLKIQADTLIKHYAKTSGQHLPRENRIITRKFRKLPTQDINPITPNEVSSIIRSIKNSRATGPDNICNLHIKNLGPIAINVLTTIFNKSISSNTIPQIWKRAAIIPILKPNKPTNDPGSYRPISLLCPAVKILERTILNRIKHLLPSPTHQHGFKPLHSTTTALTHISQFIQEGICKKKPHRTVMAAVDVSKAFESIPRTVLLQKLYNTELNNAYKKWIANWISGRDAYVFHWGQKSKVRNLKNGVPQGSVTAPSLFVLATHDIPTNENTKIITYADDITILARDRNHRRAANNVQHHLNDLQQWLTTNQMSAAAHKSSSTLFTSYNRERSHHTSLFLNNDPIPHTDNPTILGVTWDPALTFRKHIENITTKAERKLNTMRALAGTNFGQSKEDQTLLYRQFIRPTINYASPAWAYNVSSRNVDKLQITQNKALRIATGCVKSTPINHLHSETKVMQIRNHLDMRGTQFIHQAHINTNHPCHELLNLAQERNMIRYNTPTQHYLDKLSTIPITDNGHRDIHTHYTRLEVTNAFNRILDAPPPEINNSESSLPRHDRVILSRARCGHLPELNHYKKRIGAADTAPCRACANPDVEETIGHIFECPSLQNTRNANNVSATLDLWRRPAEASAFLKAAVFP